MPSYRPKFSFRKAAHASGVPLLIAALLALAMAACSNGGGGYSSTSPVANAGGPYDTNANQSVTLDGSASTAPSGQSLTYAWNFGDGTTGTGVRPSHIYTMAGNFTASLTVTDTAGTTSTTNVGVLVIADPVAAPGGPYTGIVGQNVSFNGSGSSAPPGSTLAYSWMFGDGATGSGATPTHAYSGTGVFTVTLTVTDDTFGTNSRSTTATIDATSASLARAAGGATLLAAGAESTNGPRFAYVATSLANQGSSVSTNTVDAATGALNPGGATALPASGEFALAGIGMNPSNEFLYLYGGNTILNFKADTMNGTLTQQGSTITAGGMDGAGSQLLAFHPAGGFAFLPTKDPGKASSTDADIITLYAVNPVSGELVASGTFSSQVQNPTVATMDPAGKYLYVAGAEAGIANGAPQIAGFSMDAQTGALNPLLGSPFSTQSQVSAAAMAVDPTGHFLYAAGSSAATGAAAISVFSINQSTGALSEISGSPFSLGAASSYAASMTMDPSGKYAYALVMTADESATEESVQEFSLNPATGAPTLIGTLPVATIAAGAAISTGTLTVVSGSAVPGGTTNNFLYVTSPTDGGVSVFAMDPATGLLSPETSTPAGKTQ